MAWLARTSSLYTDREPISEVETLVVVVVMEEDEDCNRRLVAAADREAAWHKLSRELSTPSTSELPADTATACCRIVAVTLKPAATASSEISSTACEMEAAVVAQLLSTSTSGDSSVVSACRLASSCTRALSLALMSSLLTLQLAPLKPEAQEHCTKQEGSPTRQDVANTCLLAAETDAHTPCPLQSFEHRTAGCTQV
jgi:hypothetical protein